jgi:plastocyanin
MGSRVLITDKGFVPARLEIACNSTVTWSKSADDLVDKTYELRFQPPPDNGNAAAAVVTATQPFSRVFTKPGSVTYYCQKYLVLKGEIVVLGAPSVQPSSTPPAVAATPPAADLNSTVPSAARSSVNTDKMEKIRASRTAAATNKGSSPPKFLFGTFGEDTETEDEAPASPAATTTRVKFPLVPSPKLANDVFDVNAANDFLRKRWLEDLNDDSVKWA